MNYVLCKIINCENKDLGKKFTFCTGYVLEGANHTIKKNHWEDEFHYAFLALTFIIVIYFSQ